VSGWRLWAWTTPGRRGRTRGTVRPVGETRAVSHVGKVVGAAGRLDPDRAPDADPGATCATLDELAVGRTGTVGNIGGGAHVVARLAALGFVPTTPIMMVQNFGRGPVIVEVRGTRVALGRREARKVYLARGE
jgi:ferrous iron transport protein A